MFYSRICISLTSANTQRFFPYYQNYKVGNEKKRGRKKLLEMIVSQGVL